MFLRGKCHLTRHMKRPKDFKKECTIDTSPDFDKISKERPLPLTEHSSRVESTNLDNHYILQNQTSNILPSALQTLMVQRSNQILADLQRTVYLREQWLRNELYLRALVSAPISPSRRIQTAHEQIVLASVLSQLQRQPSM